MEYVLKTIPLLLPSLSLRPIRSIITMSAPTVPSRPTPTTESRLYHRRRSSIFEAIEINHVEIPTSSYTPCGSIVSPSSTNAPPPPYLPPATSPPSPPSPLSFFPSHYRSSFSNATTIEFSGPESTLPPPSYRSVPRTKAEFYFFWGILCPVLWIIGASKLHYHETLIGKGKLAGIGGEGDLPTFAESANPARLSERMWREEEMIWAYRCAWAAGGFMLLLLLLGIIAVLVGQDH